MIKFKALTIYSYYDGATQFSAQPVQDELDIYMFRWASGGWAGGDPENEDGLRIYKADGHDITVTEDEVDWSEARA